MSKFIGRLVDIGIKKETTRGTAESTATFYLPKMSMSYDDKIEQVIDESSYGVIEDSVGASIISKYAEGEFEGKIGDKSIGLLFLATLGSVSTTGPTQTSVYTHTFSVQEDNQCDSLTIFQDDPNQDYTYPLGMIDSMDLDVSLGEFCKVTCAFRSLVGSTATLTPSYSAENNFLPQHGSIVYADTLAGLDAGTTVSLRSIKLSISKNLEDDRKIGSVNAVDILNKQMSIEGSAELIFDAVTFKTFMLADTAKALRIRLTNTDVTIGSSLNPKLTIDLAKVKFSEFTRNYGNDDIVTVAISFKAFYSISDSKMVTMELINEQSSY
jgi:hypothetical protein